MNRALLTLTTLVLGGLGTRAQAQATPTVDYRGTMRDFVVGISNTAKAAHPGFAVVAQDGLELLTQNGETAGPAATTYVAALDGVGQEDVFYGYNSPNQKTPPAQTTDFLAWLHTAQRFGLAPMVTDYCAARPKAKIPTPKMRSRVGFRLQRTGFNSMPFRLFHRRASPGIRKREPWRV